ncbi:phage tail tape measure protein [Acetobacterium sp.]|uniref:phage tail tape measure protein n=1 Tax=Acetobacterium sp. TaxID=1872094 RepID=UPI00271F54B6|nr:phage tail tape measure protein [Acetobacterium sp.]MDO9492668.1 phage tail tape measure protein [Acetobacterium sp.]
MAYKTGLQVGVDGEKEFSNAIKTINSDVGLLNNELRAVTAEFGRNDKSIESLTAKSKIYNKEVDLQKSKVSLLTDQYAKQWDKLDKLYRNIDEVTKIYGENSKEVEKAKKAYDDQEKSIKKLDSTLTVATSTLNKFEKQLKTTDDLLISQNSKWIGLGQSLDETGKKFDNVGNSLFKTGGMMTIGLTAPIMALGKTALTTGMDFESAMSRVKAISQATGDEFKKLNDLALKLGQDTAFSASEAAAGMENLASAGFSVDEILMAMPGMLDLAASGGLDVATASDIASAALRSFGLGADQSGHFADVLAKAAADTNANVTDMGMALKYAAAPANALGLSVEEVSAAIGVMADAGIKGEQAGTTLRGALLGLASPSGPAADAMAAIGMEVFDATGKMLPFKDVIAEVTESTKDLTEEEKVNALATIFGREAVSGMMVLIEKGPEKYDALTQSLVSSDGAAKDMAETMQDNAKSSVEQMYGSLETAAIKVETVLAPAIIDLSEGIQDLADDFSNLSPEMQEMILKSILAVAAVGPLVMGIGAFAKIVGGTIGIVGTISGAIGVMTTGAVAATPAVAGLAGAMTVLTGPVGLVIAAVGVLTVGLVALHKSYEKNRTLTEDQVEENQRYIDSTKAVSDAITSNLKTRSESLKTTEDEAIASKSLADKIFDLADKQNKSAWELQVLNGYVEEFNQLMPNANLLIDEQTGSLSLTRDATDDLIKSEMERIRIQAISESLVQNAKDQLANTRALNEASAEAKVIADETAVALQAIVDGKGTDNEKQQKTNELFDVYNQRLAPVKESVATLTKTHEDLLKEQSSLDGVLRDPSGWAAYNANTATASQATVIMADGTKVALADLGTTAPILAKNAGNGITTNMAEAIRSGNPLVGMSAQEMHDAVVEKITPLQAESMAIGSGAGAGMGSGLASQNQQLATTAQSQKDTVTGVLGPLGAFGLQTGKETIGGFHDGMNDRTGTEAVTGNIVQWVMDKFRLGFNINSPSKETHQIGVHVLQGFFDGLTSMDLGLFADNLVQVLLDSFNQGKISAMGIFNSMGDMGADLLSKMGLNLGITGGSLPVAGDITSEFGYRDDVEGVGTKNHMGIDIGAAEGTPIYAVESGTASLSTDSGYGNLVIIDNGAGLQEYYGHMSGFNISDGQAVKKGDVIGYVGSTGNSTGPHLHFGVLQNGEWIDPLSMYGFSVGSRYIPYDMPAMVHQGEMIIPKSENPYANSGGAVLPQSTAQKQPAVIQVFLNGKQISEEIFQDLNNMFGVKTGLAGRMQA